MLLAALLVFWSTANTLGASVQTPPASFYLDKTTALTAQAATRQKFRNAPALIVGQGTSSGYTIPSSLQHTYNHASDYATHMFGSPFSLPANARPFAIRVVNAQTLGSVNVSLLDDTDAIDDFEYYGPLGFGSQAQPLQIDFDTGSADIWVPVDCNCGNIHSFQANASITYHDSGKDFQVTYGSGFVSGTLAQDTVTVGPLKVYNQSIGVVQLVSENFAQSPNDGLAGLAFSTIANSQQPTLFENMVSQSQLAAPLFSFYMTRAQPRGSEVFFGGIDHTKVKGSNISWVPVASKTYWTVNMTGVMVNSLIPTRVSAIIDTGTSFIYVPDEIVAAIYQQIPGSAPASDYGDGFYCYPCDARVMISFVLGSTTLALDPRDMNIGRYTTDATGRTCVGAIIGTATLFGTSPIAILGDSFLKSYVSVFDYSHGARVGFVESIDD